MWSAHEGPCRNLIGDAEAIRRVEREALLAAGSRLNVLITGESSAVNSVVARFIHERSDRASRGFVAISCKDLQGVLFESQLFGHVRGSFPGAHQNKFGFVNTVPGGTIYLDDVSALSENNQALLLRYLETGEYMPLGGDRLQLAPHVRLIASTTVNLPDLVAAELFLPALYYRLNVVALHVPLRDGRGEIS